MTAPTESSAGYSFSPGVRWFRDAPVALLQRCLSWLLRSGRQASEVAEVVLFLTLAGLTMTGGLLVVLVLGVVGRFTRKQVDRIPLVSDIHGNY
jgi:uncharacterized membrane protein YczE